MKTILFILLVFIVCETKAQMFGVVASQSTTSVTPIIYDDFETGSISSVWSTSDGTVNTYSSFGITAPSGGGTYGLQLATTEKFYKTFASAYSELWVEVDARSGAASSTRTYIARLMTSAGGDIGFLRFSNNTSPKIELWNSAASTAYQSSTTYSTSTFYKIKARIVISATVGIIQVWVDSGSGYVLEVDESGLNTGTNNIGRAGPGTPYGGQTGYIDNFGIYDENPN